jgi:signal transduction histidine kinase
MPQADSQLFAAAEALEFQGAPQRAAAAYQELAASGDDAVRAGAILRLARVYRQNGRTNDALGAYRNLSKMSGVAIEDVPADLVARRATCGLLGESGRVTELALDAASLESDLLAGHWILDRATWMGVADQLAQWTGHALPIPPERTALSEAAGWIWEESRSLPSSGRRTIIAADVAVTVLWHTEGTEIAAIAAGPSLTRKWLDAASGEAAGRVSLLTDSGRAVAGMNAPARPDVVRRSSETGLPWTVALGAGDVPHATQDLAARRRLLSLGLGAIVLFLAGGSYLLWRVVQREIAVARLQTDFVSAVSHEFRTPLTSLRHVTELLEEDDNLPPERRKTFYAALNRSTERLHRLVESLLDFARMEVGRKPYDSQPLDAGAIAAQVVEDFQKDASARGFTIHLDTPSPCGLQLRGDAAALTHALWNLLDNAVKYSPDEREVWVSVHAHADGIAMEVEDHGLGIPTHERKEIFRKFIRGNTAKQLGIKGTGLGLAMVSHIVNAHGGAIELESREGAGSTFRIVLPGRVEA